MNADALLDATRSKDPAVVREALLSLRTLDEPARAALAERLLARLEGMVEALHASALPELEPYYGTVFWAFIAASLRLRAAHRPLVRIFLLEDYTLEQIWNDVLTEDGAILLADTYGGDPAPLRELLANADASPYARVEALSAARILVERGEMTRETALGLFSVGFDAVLARAAPRPDEENAEEAIFATLGLAEAADFAAWELRGSAQKLVDADLWDEWSSELDEEMARLQPGMEPKPVPRPWPVGDVWESVSWWDWFKDQPDRVVRRRSLWAEPAETAEADSGEPWDLEDVEGLPEDGREPRDDLPPEPVRREGPKVGRNDPCPCGSGKKFKKCCGA